MTASSPPMPCWCQPSWPNSTSPCRPLPTSPSPSHNAPTPTPTSRSLTPCPAPGRSLLRVSSWPLAHNGTAMRLPRTGVSGWGRRAPQGYPEGTASGRTTGKAGWRVLWTGSFRGLSAFEHPRWLYLHVILGCEPEDFLANVYADFGVHVKNVGSGASD